MGSTLPTVLVLCGLFGTAWWGHHTDWTFGWSVDGSESDSRVNSGCCLPHGWPQGECAACRLGREVVQFQSLEDFDRSGVELDVVGRGDVVETIAAPGEASFDPARTAHLTSRATGTITRVLRRLGETVAAGDVLVLVDALEVGKAKSELLKALSDLRLKRGLVERLTPLAATGAAPARQLIEAEAAQRGAEIRLLAAEESLANLGLRVRGAQFADLPIPKVLEELKFIGIPEQHVTAGDRAEGSSNLIPVRSPVAGVVVAADAVVGEVVGPATELFTVVDRSRLWVTLEVAQSDLSRVATGQRLLFRPDGADVEVEGRVEWIADTIDEGTRTLEVRGEVVNETLRIKAGAFGSGRLVVRETADAVVVPRAAVHRQGER